MMTTTGLRNAIGSRRFVGALCGLTLAVSAVPALGLGIDLPFPGFSLCVACDFVKGGLRCGIKFCGPNDACTGQLLDTDGDGVEDAVRAKCVKTLDGLD